MQDKGNLMKGSSCVYFPSDSVVDIESSMCMYVLSKPVSLTFFACAIEQQQKKRKEGRHIQKKNSNKTKRSSSPVAAFYSLFSCFRHFEERSALSKGGWPRCPLAPLSSPTSALPVSSSFTKASVPSFSPFYLRTKSLLNLLPIPMLCQTRFFFLLPTLLPAAAPSHRLSSIYTTSRLTASYYIGFLS